MSIINMEVSTFSDLSVVTPKAEPFIKWAGGKQALLAQILPHFPKSFERYYEPFIGGGSVFFALNHHKAFVNDENEWLIDTYKAIRDNYVGVVRELDKLTNTREDFLRIRAIDPRSISLEKRAAQFIYLNKTCFRGLFRVNKKGQFNVPYGEYQRRYYAVENLAAAANALKKVEFTVGDFEKCLIGITSNDFVYFDPPYFKLGGYSDFNRYTAGQFREAEHLRLASLCNELDAEGIRWAVSNSDTPFIREIFKGFRFENIKARREINLKSQDRNVNELLILNY
ncbi:DNA adenine methylase [Bdellovibrio sp. HCB337]|uniref:DNA adenine methylase n=1 Tax=Bdellovibrio sp. HCB337 TaxID=3394358 RepID=UPI0039A6E21A